MPEGKCGKTMDKELFAQIPSIEKWLQDETINNLLQNYPRQWVVKAMRETAEEYRRQILRGETEGKKTAALNKEVERILQCMERFHLRRVINGTGVVIHTNLGRAPLAGEAIHHMVETSTGYSNLELELESGKRGSRYDHVEELICELTGAEAAMVVNNNAAAVLLVLDTLAAAREVIVSRGQLVEIGGSFRVPEVMAKSGARLIEVGTTNRTYVRDYRQAITEQTALLMQVHPSNYRVVGFTAEVETRELVALGHETGIPVFYDLGSGLLAEDFPYGTEPTVQKVMAEGVDIVTFSGDKLLGGPQGGIIAGKRPLVEKMRHNPLTRALRIDKLTLAALEATLHIYRKGEQWEKIPALRMLRESVDALERKAALLKERLMPVIEGRGTIETVPGSGRAGGGSLPEVELPSTVVRMRFAGREPMEVQEALRRWRTPVIVRVEQEAVVFDPRTLLEEDFAEISEALASVLG